MSTPTTGEAAKWQAEAVELAAALHTIYRESHDAEACRVARSALDATETGRNYMNANPIGY